MYWPLWRVESHQAACAVCAGRATTTKSIHIYTSFIKFHSFMLTAKSLEAFPVLHDKLFATNVHQDTCAHGMYQAIRTQVWKLSTCFMRDQLESLFGAIVASDLAKGMWRDIMIVTHWHLGCIWVYLAEQPLWDHTCSYPFLLGFHLNLLSHPPWRYARAPRGSSVPALPSGSPSPRPPWRFNWWMAE